MALDPPRVKALFNAALDLPDAVDRPAFLDRECGNDRELRQRLEDLLAAYDHPASALERPPTVNSELPTAPLSDAEQAAAAEDRTAGFSRETASFRSENPTTGLIGMLIAGRYKLRQEIGEGGMGSVFLAEQLQPFKRQVALKLIKAGMDSRTVLARFESERQALALMDHPNIAKVLDAGTTDNGRPFFVMELVKGVPLTEYCDLHRLGLQERLTLFRHICSAVQHAHQKGVIHRDLKPSNILVESHDGHPVPKVIDFGLAKATSGLQLTEHSLFSAFGTVAGTPLYMAPEQTSFNAIDIDTRADVYALGVILYESLTGSTPIQRETFKKAALDEMLRVIREVEPPTPSSRLSSSETLASLAATRQTDPARLGRFLRGDLDWIVMKALSKERQRRYESPSALAHDIERFLNHEPVSAGPPTAGYRFKKFVRRHRPQVVAASLLLLALVAGIVGTTLGLIEARRQTTEATRQEKIAIAESIQKDKALLAESTQRRQAEKRLTQIEKANEILGSIFKNLNPKNAEKDGKPLSALLGERLDQATAQLEGEAIGDPLTVARMQQTLGESQLGLGSPEKAIGLFTKALATFTNERGSDHPDTLEVMNDLAGSYQAAGKLDKALPLLKETLDIRKAKLGPENPSTVNSMNNLAEGYRDNGRLDLALPLFEETLRLMVTARGPDHLETIATTNNLALGLQAAGKLDKALPLFEEALRVMTVKLGPDHPDTLTSRNNLANCYLAAEKLDKALPLYQANLVAQTATLGSEHPDTLRSMNNLAEAYRHAGRLDEAIPLFETTLKIKKVRLPPDHPETITTMNNLALSLQAVGKLDRALPLYEETLKLMTGKLGPDHPSTLTVRNNLANCYLAAQKLDKALPLYQTNLVTQTATLGPKHPDTLRSMHNLAEGYRMAGRLDQALPLFEKTLEIKKVELGPEHLETIATMNNLALGLQAAGKLDRALPLFEETLRVMIKKLGPEHPDLLVVMNNLAVGFQAAGNPTRALPLLRQLSGFRKIMDGADSPSYAASLNVLALALLQLEMWNDAEAALREALKIREAKEPDVWTTFNSRSMIGKALLGQKKYTEAEPLLRAGYEGMKQRADKIPPQGKVRLGEALDRLIELAEATHKPDDVTMWKKERAKLPPGTAPTSPAGKK